MNSGKFKIGKMLVKKLNKNYGSVQLIATANKGMFVYMYNRQLKFIIEDSFASKNLRT